MVEREAEAIRRRVAREKRQAGRERSDRRSQGDARGAFSARLRNDNDTIRQNLRSAAAAAEVVRRSAPPCLGGSDAPVRPRRAAAGYNRPTAAYGCQARGSAAHAAGNGAGRGRTHGATAREAWNAAQAAEALHKPASEPRTPKLGALGAKRGDTAAWRRRRRGRDGGLGRPRSRRLRRGRREFCGAFAFPLEATLCAAPQRAQRAGRRQQRRQRRASVAARRGARGVEGATSALAQGGGHAEARRRAGTA